MIKPYKIYFANNIDNKKLLNSIMSELREIYFKFENLLHKIFL